MTGIIVGSYGHSWNAEGDENGLNEASCAGTEVCLVFGAPKQPRPQGLVEAGMQRVEVANAVLVGTAALRIHDRLLANDIVQRL